MKQGITKVACVEMTPPNPTQHGNPRKARHLAGFSYSTTHVTLWRILPMSIKGLLLPFLAMV